MQQLVTLMKRFLIGKMTLHGQSSCAIFVRRFRSDCIKSLNRIEHGEIRDVNLNLLPVGCGRNIEEKEELTQTQCADEGCQWKMRFVKVR